MWHILKLIFNYAPMTQNSISRSHACSNCTYPFRVDNIFLNKSILKQKIKCCSLFCFISVHIDDMCHTFIHAYTPTILAMKLKDRNHEFLCFFSEPKKSFKCCMKLAAELLSCINTMNIYFTEHLNLKYCMNTKGPGTFKIQFMTHHNNQCATSRLTYISTMYLR